MLPSATDKSWTERAAFLKAFERLAPTDAPPIAEVFASVDKAFSECAPILKLSIPAEALVDVLDSDDDDV